MNKSNNNLNKYNKILFDFFGFKSLKNKQYEIIDKVVNDKKDVCAVLATGFGKSICYQLPFLITNKCVIIISPLLSLMGDQKIKLDKLNIPVCCLNSECSDKMDIINDIFDGNNKIIFMTPEYLIKSQEFIKSLNEQEQLCLFAIDEAHCVSTWGNDFRTSYTQLYKIREWVNNVPILALTATASDKVKDDICKQLTLNNPHRVIGSFDRPNLYISVNNCTNNMKNDFGYLLDKYKNEYIIIYCKTRLQTEEISKKINNLKIGINSLPYHAGLSTDIKNKTQKKFVDGDCKCIVATVAFGMGIDISTVRLVIHYGCPKNIESYYQEIGRAGRDGKDSYCYLFYSNKDFMLNRFFLDSMTNKKEKEYQLNQLRIMERYIYTSECRRKIILENFNENYDSNNCLNKCDNCKKKINIVKKDFTILGYKLLILVKAFNGNYGIGTFINILRGSKAKTVPNHIKKLTMYGSGIEHSQNWWKIFTRMLINKEYLRLKNISGSFGTVLECTKKGIKWIKNIDPTKLEPYTIDNKNKLIMIIPEEMKNLNKNPKIKINKKSNKKSNKKLNHGKKWNQQEDDLLIQNIKIKSIKKISQEHERSDGAIRARLKSIAYKLYQQDKSINEIIDITQLKKKQIVDYIHKENNKNKKK